MEYICPMHPEVTSEKKSRCPKCGMDLVKKSDLTENSHQKMHHAKSEEYSLKDYLPLIVIISLIFITSLVVSSRPAFDFNAWMRYFMAGFFLVFGGFKLLDLKGFASGYFTYDLLAQKWFSYGYIYPFLEVLLGYLYILNWNPFVTNIVTFILMTFSGIGVGLKLLKKEKFQCACLGTAIKLPLTKVTLIEDFGMALMAGVSLLMIS